jgi:hypothetical protein
MELAGREESASLRSISAEVTGDAWVNSEGLQGVVTGGGEAGGGGAMFLAPSWLAMTTRNLFRVSFIARVASTCSLSLFSICWNFSSSMAGESTTFDDCYRGEQVVGSKQRSFTLLCVGSFVLLSYTNQCP